MIVRVLSLHALCVPNCMCIVVCMFANACRLYSVCSCAFSTFAVRAHFRARTHMTVCKCVNARGQDYKEKHKTRLKTNVKRTVLNNTKLRHF